MPEHTNTSHPSSFRQKASAIGQQLKCLERYIRFYRKAMKPAPMTPHGFKLYGSRAMQDGRFEPLETQLVNDILPHCDAFINVGANVGYYCCHAIKHGKPVFAFEPIDLNVRHLLANIRLNGWSDKIEIFPTALGAENGILEIFGAGTGASLIKGWANTSQFDVTLAPVLTLDNVLADRIIEKRCFIMVDIEGAERFMLAGAKRFLNAETKPVWMIEICVDEHQPNGAKINPNLLQTFDFFFETGYGAWTADASPRRITRDEVAAVANSQVNTLGTHNFIFADPKALGFLTFLQ